LGATIRPALRGAKVKFKGDGLVWLADEGRRSLHSLQIYIVENKKVFFSGALCWRRPQAIRQTRGFPRHPAPYLLLFTSSVRS
jgi:hypothetical protein